MQVKSGDNWLIIGRKGSGKTTFGKLLLSRLSRIFNNSRIYVLDIKMRDFLDWPGIVRQDTAPSRPGSNQKIQIWQPVVINPEEMEKWLHMVRHDPPAILEIDELLALIYGHRDNSEEMTRITKLGRALPITTISHTQDVVQLPRGVISQPDHIARFMLRHPYERRVANVLLGGDVAEPPLYSFWYQHAENGGEPILYKNVQEFLGISKNKRS